MRVLLTNWKQNRDDSSPQIFQQQTEISVYNFLPLSCFFHSRMSASEKYTKKQKISLLVLAMSEFFGYCSYSIIAPFYPKEAEAKGMSETTIGLVFSFYALVVFLMSPIFGKLVSFQPQPHRNQNKLFIISVAQVGGQTLFYGRNTRVGIM